MRGIDRSGGQYRQERDTTEGKSNVTPALGGGLAFF
jgi:hypothetical protein